MRKFHLVFFFLLICLTAILFLSVSSIIASTSGLELVSPVSCPTSGCAAGQRLNFRADFTLNPVYLSGTNSQICFYAPAESQTGGSYPWADFSSGWISDTGILSTQPYSQGQVGAVCTDLTDPGDVWITGVYAQIPNAVTEDQIDLVLNIHPTANLDGKVTVKILKVDASGSNWSLTSSFSKDILVAEISDKAYVAKNALDCGPQTPCFINSGDDSTNGLGTGLRDAVVSLPEEGEIQILKDYLIKDNTVLIDKNVSIFGEENAMVSTLGVNCNQPMLQLTAGGAIKGLTINDGNCSNPSSRTLIQINSSSDISIENNTLNSGLRAVDIIDNSGTISVAFNQITNNQNYAVYREEGLITSGQVRIYANNIYNNQSGYQVHCNGLGNADHNFWGEGVSANDSVFNCSTAVGKHLGAQIQLSASSAGVEAVRITATPIWLSKV